MNYSDILLLQVQQRTLGLPFLIQRRRKVKNFISINNLVAIPVENSASYYDTNIDLPIKRIDGTEIGYLFFTKGIEVTNLHSLSEPKFVCYLNDVPTANTVLNGSAHKFQSNYAIIYKPYFDQYFDDFLVSSPIWGGFNHKYSSLSISPPGRKVITEIIADKYSRFSKDYYFESSVRGIKHTLAFERFLKYYHLLELNFDFDLIERIKGIDPSRDAKSISTLLNEYKKEDIERLRYLFHSYCTDPLPIITKLNQITGHIPVAKDIFYVFGKESNPLKDYDNLTRIIGHADGFTQANCNKYLGNQVDSAEKHRKFICNLCAYWIYRVRNSIAHKKIGEYIMTHTEENFVLNFAEPLLLEILKQVFK